MVMITGDYPKNRDAHCPRIGLANPDTAITGAEIAAWSTEELCTRVQRLQRVRSRRSRTEASAREGAPG